MNEQYIRYLKKLYDRLLNAMHSPYLQDEELDPHIDIHNEFKTILQSIPSPSVLEIGSRNVTGINRRSNFKGCSEYTGFDIHPGEGVDVVGDIHKLSSCVRNDHYDVVYSISVFEHLLFPWKAVLEINKVMKTGGVVYIATHPVWPSHELPWDFWRFPVNGFNALFNKY